jgi:predicted dehydrogenase
VFAILVALRSHIGHDLDIRVFFLGGGPKLSLVVGYRKAHHNAKYTSPVKDSVHFAECAALHFPKRKGRNA